MRSVRGDHTVIVTPTASGKTLCYNLPVLDFLLREPEGRAMYLFPTKALAQDQYAGLQDLIELAGSDIKTYPYDGDTPAAERRLIRRAGEHRHHQSGHAPLGHSAPPHEVA